MAFTVEPTRAPSGLGNIIVTLKDAVAKFDPLSGSTASYQSAHFQIEITMTDGGTVLRRGDLVPYITTPERLGLMTFMETLRARAASQILGAS